MRGFIAGVIFTLVAEGALAVSIMMNRAKENNKNETDCSNCS